MKRLMKPTSLEVQETYRDYKMQEQRQTNEPYIDEVIKVELDKIRDRVINKDMDYVACIDGDEGSGKSVLAMQICKYLDNDFGLDNIVFNSDDFINAIKNPNLKKGACILLDEAYNAVNSRATMSEVNRSMIAVATEMRQKNLFVMFVLPSFFDLDRNLAIHRTRALFHVYFGDDYSRGQYVVFPKDTKRDLYLVGKKRYSYSYPRSPFPPLRFFNQYVINEDEYRAKKAHAFQKRSVSNMAKRWMMQRNAYIKYLYQTSGMTQEELCKIPSQYGVVPMSQQSFSFVLKEIMKDGGA